MCYCYIPCLQSCLCNYLCNLLLPNKRSYWPQLPYLLLYVVVNIVSKFLDRSTNNEKCIQGDCYMITGIYRLYTGAALFHIILAAILLISMKSAALTCFAASLHNELWALKIPAWFGLMFLVTRIPNHTVQFIGTHLFSICALIFVIIQSIISIDFAYYICESIKEKYEESSSSLWGLLVAVGTLGVIALEVFISVLIIMIASRNSCDEFEWIIATNLILCVIVLGVSILHRVQEGNQHSGLTLSSIITLYSTYTVLVALLSNSSVPCSAFDRSDKITALAPALSWVVTFLYLMHTTIYSARMGYLMHLPDGYSELPTEDPGYETRTLNAKSFFLMDTSEDSHEYIDKNVVFSYSFFHIVFACSFMYTAKILTNWSIVGYDDNAIYSYPTNISLYLRIGAAWATLGMLVWTLVAPVVFPDRFL